MSLIEAMDEEILAVYTKIIIMANEKLGDLNQKLFLMLSDYAAFAIERVNMGMIIEIPFFYEIKNLYGKEYEVAMIAREIIKDRLGIILMMMKFDS